MLETIVIKNFTIIDHVHIEFDQGMTALTGETGAGKSILLDAIKLVLGDRADTNCVKTGCEKADISVSFNISGLDHAQQWLQEQELLGVDECILRRVIQANGRSKAFINGSPVPLSQLRVLGEMLVDLHGQHEHQSLQRNTVQQELLDTSLSDPTLLEKTRKSFFSWKQLLARRQRVLDESSEKQQRIDLLKLYTQELDELGLRNEEVQHLQEEYHRLSHAGQIKELTSSVIDHLYENEGVNIQSLLSLCCQQIEQLTQIDASLKEPFELLKNSLIQIQDAASTLRSYQDSIDLDPTRINWINERLSQTQNQARKHQLEPEKLVLLSRNLHQELDELQFDKKNIAQIEKQLAEAAENYLARAGKLSALRRSTAANLSRQISEVMQTLGMHGGLFEIQLESDDSPESFSASGIDRVQYFVSVNPGQPAKRLNRVASGGELSRISLAIQVILSESSEIPTLIFDEVDSGIGGGVAEIVGRKLHQVAKHRQVFCVTHLPQVAAQAHQHYQVCKTKTDSATSTDVIALDSQLRLEETARMLGGITITEQTLAHAREMIGGGV